MAGFIMAGRIQAAIFVVLSTLVSLLIPPLIVFSNASIALITLRKGWQQGALYTLLATATLVVVSALLQQESGSGIVAGIATWLPIVLIASVLAMTSSWNKTLQLTMLLGIGGVLAFHLIYPDSDAFWKPMLDKMKPLIQQAYQLGEGNIDEKIDKAVSWMTGTFAAAFSIFAIISLIVARNWQARLYNPGGFGEEFRQIAIGKQAAIAILVCIAIAVLTSNQLIVELIMVGVVIFMFQGLSLAHALVKQREMNSGWLVGLYVLMFLLLIQMIVLLATFGIIDNFVDFRKKVSSANR